jgi:predicted enzyme related to lactoylglutathione lyase
MITKVVVGFNLMVVGLEATVSLAAERLIGVQPKQPIGPFGFRAIVIDSEGNRVALHSD